MAAVLATAVLGACAYPNAHAEEPAPTDPTVTTMPALRPDIALPQLDLDGVDFTAIARNTYGMCGEWHDTAINVGWSEDEWSTLRRVIIRETGATCDPTVVNDNENTGDFSHGLTQINLRGSLWDDRRVRCALDAPTDLLDPAKNLACALVLWKRSGWAPWRL